MKRLRPVLASMVLAALAVAWLALPGLAQSKGVLAYDTSFNPSDVTVQPDDSVTWTNVGENVHNIIGSSANWPSGERLLVPGGSTTIQFSIIGVYDYTCEYHPSFMWGTVQVEPSPTPTETPTLTPTPTPSASASASPSPSTSASPTESPSATPTTAAPSPSPSSSPTPVFPTELPSFGENPPSAGGPADPELASVNRTPPPDSPLKPPLTIVIALVLILLFAANPLFKPRYQAVRVPPPGPSPRNRSA